MSGDEVFDTSVNKQRNTHRMRQHYWKPIIELNLAKSIPLNLRKSNDFISFN